MSVPLVTLQNVNVSRNDRALLQDISLQVEPGEIVTVIGPNGAGKSTLIKLISGLLKPTSGRVTRQPKLRIGYMPQRLAFDASLPMTVAGFLGLSSASRRQIEAAQQRLHIGHLSHAAVHVLSGGELQRLLLARALLRQPQLLVLDEPVQGVDVRGQTELYRLISELRDELQCGVLMVSHDLHLVMAETDRVVCLNHHICCQGQPEKVSLDPAYLQLFGHEAANNIAVYTHQHDHRHDLHGNVVEDGACHHDHGSGSEPHQHEEHS